MVLHQPLSKVRLRGRESFSKIGQCASLAFKKLAFDLVDQDIPTPAAVHCLPNVPLSLLSILYGVQNPDLVDPGQLCNNLLRKLLVGVRFSKCAHVFQVPGSKSTHFRERSSQILRQAINDFCAPSFILHSPGSLLPALLGRFSLAILFSLPALLPLGRCGMWENTETLWQSLLFALFFLPFGTLPMKYTLTFEITAIITDVYVGHT